MHIGARRRLARRRTTAQKEALEKRAAQEKKTDDEMARKSHDRVASSAIPRLSPMTGPGVFGDDLRRGMVIVGGAQAISSMSPLDEIEALLMEEMLIGDTPVIIIDAKEVRAKRSEKNILEQLMAKDTFLPLALALNAGLEDE
jgi:hypothetical protein